VSPEIRVRTIMGTTTNTVLESMAKARPVIEVDWNPSQPLIDCKLRAKEAMKKAISTGQYFLKCSLL
jgi:hypothetical protein